MLDNVIEKECLDPKYWAVKLNDALNACMNMDMRSIFGARST